MFGFLRQRRPLATCLALFVAAYVLISWWLPNGQESNFRDIHIFGNSAFIEQVERSLSLLRARSPDAFEMTRQYIKQIQQSRRSGIRAYADPPTFDLSPKTADYSVTWCAGSIAHDSYHSKLYHEYLAAHGEPVPDDAWGGQAKELECIRHQVQVMKDIGAPEYEIKYLNHLDGSHYDLDGDGKETWYDYWLQDW